MMDDKVLSDRETKNIVMKLTGNAFNFFESCLEKSSEEDYWLNCVKLLTFYFNTTYYYVINQIGLEGTKKYNHFFRALVISFFSPIISLFIASLIPTSNVEHDQAIFVFGHAINICIFIIISSIIISILATIVRYKKYKKKFNTLVCQFVEDSKNFKLTDEIIQRTISVIPEFEYLFKKV